MIRAAVLSDDRFYRYWLTRIWDVELPVLVFVMLNPSVADHEIDDPTIRRCISFAKREGYGGIIVVNMFAYRATAPTAMMLAPDPVGPENDMHLIQVFNKHKIAVAAWGAHGAHRGRDREVTSIAELCGVKLFCLGTTAEGQPRHPVRLAANEPLIPFEIAA
jgi:hypothetical protein